MKDVVIAGVGSTTFFSQGSRIVASSHTFEYVGSGNQIVTATPKRGGVTNQENEGPFTIGTFSESEPEPNNETNSKQSTHWTKKSFLPWMVMKSSKKNSIEQPLIL